MCLYLNDKCYSLSQTKHNKSVMTPEGQASTGLNFWNPYSCSCSQLVISTAMSSPIGPPRRSFSRPSNALAPGLFCKLLKPSSAHSKPEELDVYQEKPKHCLINHHLASWRVMAGHKMWSLSKWSAGLSPVS